MCWTMGSYSYSYIAEAVQVQLYVPRDIDVRMSFDIVDAAWTRSRVKQHEGCIYSLYISVSKLKLYCMLPT